MARFLSQHLTALVCTFLCLLLVSGPAVAGASDRSYVASHFMLELASDAAAEMKREVEDSILSDVISKSEQKQINHLMGNPITENLIMVGDVRAKALAKHKPVPGFASIDGAKERTNDELIAWSKESLELLEMLQDKLKDQKDSIKEMSQEDMLCLQRLMEQMAQLEEMISKVMKAAEEAQSGIAGNLKAS